MATPIRVNELAKLLRETQYDKEKTEYLVDGFTNGFELGFYGPRDVVREAPNMKLRCGSQTELWNKIMQEVQEGHTAGPFKDPNNKGYSDKPEFPFKRYWQSPTGLIPKKGQPNKTRMIVNLSYKGDESINAHAKKEECTVKYNDMDEAIKMIQRIKKEHHHVYLAKCDGRAAFHQLPVAPRDYPLLVIKA